MSDDNLAGIRDEKAKKIQHPKGKLTAYERLNLLLDEGSFSEIDQHVTSEENPDGEAVVTGTGTICLLYTSPSPRDRSLSRMPSSA